MQKNIVIFLILHIFIYFTVILVLNSHEVIQKSFYFLCLLNYVCVQKRFFLVDDLMGGGGKYADYFQVQIPISKQYFILWLNQFYFSVFCLTI